MRPTVLRRALALAGVALIISTTAAYADNVNDDGDIATVGNDVSYVESPNLVTTGPNAGLYTGEACSARGSAVAGLVTVTRTAGGTHFNAGATVTVTVTPSATAVAQGITASGGTVSVPTGSGWDGGGDTFSRAIATTVPAGAANNVAGYTIDYSVYGPGTGSATVGGVYTLTGSYLVKIDCPAPPVNEAPVASASWVSATVGCNVEATLEVSFTDADGPSPYSAAIDWDYDGSTFDNDWTDSDVTSPFQASHTYSTPGTYTAAAIVTDGDGAASDVATADIEIQQTYTASFLQPLDGSSPSYLIANTMKKGRIVPVKVTIVDDCTGDAVTGSTGEVVTVKVITAAFQSTMSNDAVETFSDAGSSSSGTTSFRWSDLGYWIYNLDSSGLTVNTSYEVHVVVDGIQVDTTYAILRPTK